jgi:hypothetical protein
MAAAGTAKTQRPTLNFDAYFTLTDSSSPAETTVAPVTTGSESKLATAATAGTSGHCAQWDASGGIGDAGGACSVAPAFTGTSGYQTLLSGLILEWGTANAAGAGPTSTNVSLPLACPTGLLMPPVYGSLDYGSNPMRNVAYTTAANSTGFTVQSDSSPVAVSWEVICY